MYFYYIYYIPLVNILNLLILKILYLQLFFSILEVWNIILEDCYVTLFQAPLNVWKSYHNDKYPILNSFEIFDDMSVRFGAYGDPYAIPVHILTDIKSRVKNNTSYTHQWQNASEALM